MAGPRVEGKFLTPPPTLPWRGRMPKGLYECVNCGHREVMDSTEPLLEGACPECGGDMILVKVLEDSESPEASESSQEAAGIRADVEALLRKFYSLELIEVQGAVAVFRVTEIHERDFEAVLAELEPLGYWAALKRAGNEVRLFLFPAEQPKRDNPLVGATLFVLTLISTLWAGYILGLSYVRTLSDLGIPTRQSPYLIAVAFSVSVMGILGTHELGHKVAASMHNVRSTFPYFIPFPNLLGTLGAVIRVKSPIPTRKAAVDLGVSGPIAGLLVAIPVTVIGIKLSPVIPMSALPGAAGKGIYFGTNLVFILLEKLILGARSGDNYLIQLHPVAIAGWVGIFVTFLNLIPAAQLDGGHVARAFLPERAHRYLTLGLGLLILLMSYYWAGWAIWAILVLFLGAAGNPGALDEVSPVPLSRKVLALIAALIFVITVTPVPFYTG